MEQSLEQSVAKLADSVLQLANAMQFLAMQDDPAPDPEPKPSCEE